jgi:hypothetical protein
MGAERRERLPRLIRDTLTNANERNIFSTREPDGELAAGPDSRQKKRHPVDGALNPAASSHRRIKSVKPKQKKARAKYETN